MKLKYTIGLSLLLAGNAFSQTTLWSQNFNDVPFVSNGWRGLNGAGFNLGSGNTSLTVSETEGLGYFDTGNGFIVSNVGEDNWKPTNGQFSGVLVSYNNQATHTWQTVTLAAGHTMTLSFDVYGIGDVRPDNVIYTPTFNGLAFITPSIQVVNGSGIAYTFSGNFTNTTGSAITGAIEITRDNTLGSGVGYDNFLVTVPEPSSALLSAFGMLALLRRRR